MVETKFRDFLAGVKLRVPFGGFVPNLSVAYGQQVFAIAQQMTMQDLPQLAYQFMRFAPGARMYFTPTVVLDVGAAYLLVLDPGSGANSIRDPNRFFPKATAFGFDVTASLAFRLTGSIGARAGADLRAYTISNNQNTRGVVGAVNRYITVWAGLEVVLDGQGAAAGGDDDEPAKPSKRKRRRASSSSSDDETRKTPSSSVRRRGIAGRAPVARSRSRIGVAPKTPNTGRYLRTRAERPSRPDRALNPLTCFFRRVGCIFDFETAADAPERATRGEQRPIEVRRGRPRVTRIAVDQERRRSPGGGRRGGREAEAGRPEAGGRRPEA